jgi:hypothetical protein
MGDKRPWCERTKSWQKVDTVDEQQVWKHAPRMYLGLMIYLIVVFGIIGLHMAIGVLYVKWVFFDARKPTDPGFWSSVLPAWAITISIFAALYLVSLAFTCSGKHRLKQLLLPVRCQRCPKCFYELSARDRASDICSECGVVAPRRECVRLWCKLLRSRP